MTCKIGTFDLENLIGHPVSGQRVGTDSLYISGMYSKGIGQSSSFTKSFTNEFYYAGRYAKFFIPGASHDTVNDLSPNTSVVRFISMGTAQGGKHISDWFAVDDSNYEVLPGRPDVITFWVQLSRVRKAS